MLLRASLYPFFTALVFVGCLCMHNVLIKTVDKVADVAASELR